MEENTNFEDIRNFDHYVVEVRFKVNRDRAFPLLSFKEEKEVEDIMESGKGIKRKTYVRSWTNDLNELFESGSGLIVDKITLEDLIFYHEIDEIEVIRGVYWKNGYNERIGQVIEHLFNERKRYKNEKNIGMSNCLKLMMNSAYGKMNLKDSETQFIVKSNHEEVKGKENNNYYKKYIVNNYYSVKNWVEINKNSVLIECEKPDYTHFNACHLGGIVLSNSKKIMNQVFDTCDEIGLKILYTDTDSLQIEIDGWEDLERLNEKFKEKFGKTLIGSDLGQFHSDFEVKGLVGLQHAKESYFLGKKMYYCKVYDDFGDSGDHARCKGIPGASIDYYCKERNENYLDFYRKLYEGNKVKIDICKMTGNGVKFVYGKNNVMLRKEFKRTIKC